MHLVPFFKKNKNGGGGDERLLTHYVVGFAVVLIASLARLPSLHRAHLLLWLGGCGTAYGFVVGKQTLT